MGQLLLLIAKERGDEAVAAAAAEQQALPASASAAELNADGTAPAQSTAITAQVWNCCWLSVLSQTSKAAYPVCRLSDLLHVAKTEQCNMMITPALSELDVDHACGQFNHPFIVNLPA